jgi:anti-sigma regulatory factor (Ser/Thr protein kinase)
MVGKEIRLQRRRERHRLARQEKLSHRRLLHITRAQWVFQHAPFRELPDGSSQRSRCITPPSTVSLSSNYKETIEFLEAVRATAGVLKGTFWVDFTKIKHVTPAGALLLVAEFDRWKEKTAGERLRSLDLPQWTPSVRKRLKDMGFFTVLNASCDLVDPEDPDEERFLEFVTGHKSEGAKAQHLRQAIEGLGAKLRDANALYDGLIEAMTNVEHHAYPVDAQVKRWWMSASVNSTSNKLTVMFVDHGLTIPRTLPKSDLWEVIRAGIGGMGVLSGLLKDHARLIEAAISVDRTRLQTKHRGNGLKRDIQGYVELHEAVGSMRIISGSGQYIFRKRSSQADEVELTKLPVPFRGTFIEWVIEDYATSETI